MTDLFVGLLVLSGKAALVLAVVLAVQASLKRWLPASFRLALWALVGLRLVVPSLPGSPLSVLGATEVEPVAGLPALNALPAALAPALPTPSHPLVATEPNLVLVAAASLWLLVATLFVLRFVWGHRKVLAVIRRSVPVAPGPLLERFEACRSALEIRRPVRFLTSTEVAGPATYGLLDPVVLVPAQHFEGLSAHQQQHALLHELAHLQRHDALWLSLAHLLVAVHWFNPLLWVARRRFRTDLEMACDATVLAHLASPERAGYGRTLLDLGVRPEVGLPSPCFAVDSKQQLQRRIRMISRFRPRTLRRTAILTGFAALLVVLTLTEFQSSWADSPENQANRASLIARELSERLQDSEQHATQTASWLAELIEDEEVPAEVAAAAIRDEAHRVKVAGQAEVAERLEGLADFWLAGGVVEPSAAPARKEPLKATVEQVRSAGSTMFQKLLAGDTGRLEMLDPPSVIRWQDCPAISHAQLVERLGAEVELPQEDGWGGTLEFCFDPNLAGDYGLIGVRSPGSDGRFDGDRYAVGGFGIGSSGEDIVWIDGYFARWPQS